MGAGHGRKPWRATQLLALALGVAFAIGVLLGQAGYGPKPEQHATAALEVARPVSAR